MPGTSASIGMELKCLNLAHVKWKPGYYGCNFSVFSNFLGKCGLSGTSVQVELLLWQIVAVISVWHGNGPPARLTVKCF